MYSWIRKSNALFLIIVCSTKSSRLAGLIVCHIKYCPNIL
nr:MAG TPA: hypothetical protein [Caudoviricetes sp.]